ncbi:hypothetical protein Aduo_002196 [Ancylostoma duodenale]
MCHLVGKVGRRVPDADNDVVSVDPALWGLIRGQRLFGVTSQTIDAGHRRTMSARGAAHAADGALMTRRLLAQNDNTLIGNDKNCKKKK